jgi:hypothetical protein
VLTRRVLRSTVIGEIALAMRDLSRGRSMEKEFALTPKGFLKVLMYLSLGHGALDGIAGDEWR